MVGNRGRGWLLAISAIVCSCASEQGESLTFDSVTVRVSGSRPESPAVPELDGITLSESSTTRVAMTGTGGPEEFILPTRISGTAETVTVGFYVSGGSGDWARRQDASGCARDGDTQWLCMIILPRAQLGSDIPYPTNITIEVNIGSDVARFDVDLI